MQRSGDWDLTQPRPHAQQACSDRSKQPQPSACTHTKAKPAGRAPPSLAQAVGVAVDDACAASDGAQLPRPARAFQGIQRAAAGLCAVSQAGVCQRDALQRRGLCACRSVCECVYLCEWEGWHG